MAPPTPRSSLPPGSPAPSAPGSALPTAVAGATYPLSPRAQPAAYARRSSTLQSQSLTSHSTGGASSIAGSDAASTAATTAAAAAVGSEILDRPRDKSKNAEVGASALAFLYGEMVAYTQGRVSGIAELERKLSLMGYHVGSRLLLMLTHRQAQDAPLAGAGAAAYSRVGNPKREPARLLPALVWVHTSVWKAVFGKAADSLERSTERNDEYMISTNTPLFSRSMAVPKEMSQLSVEAFTAGIVEAVLDGLGFPARVTAHTVATPEHPLRTTILVKLAKSVMEREEALGPA